MKFVAIDQPREKLLEMQFRSYYSVPNELSIVDEILMRGNRIVIPMSVV